MPSNGTGYPVPGSKYLIEYNVMCGACAQVHACVLMQGYDAQLLLDTQTLLGTLSQNGDQNYHIGSSILVRGHARTRVWVCAMHALARQRSMRG